MALTERNEPIVDLDPSETVDVAGTVVGLRSAFDAGHTRPMTWRLAQLDGLLALLEHEAPALEAALAADLGKPALEGFAADIGSTATEIAYIRKHAPKWAKARRVGLPLTARPGSGTIVPEPLGVALVVAPWNYPIQLLLLPMAAAIAAGNAVLGKPSEISSATSAALAQLLPRYVDDTAIAIVEGDAVVATELLEQRFDHIFYTGSTEVGRLVYQAAARHLTPVTLELGGKSPVIIDDSANIDIAARRIAWGKWLNAGQTCVAPDYVLVTEKHRDRLVSGITDAWAEFGGGSADNPDFTSIVSDRHTERLADLLRDHGGTVAAGGSADIGARHIEPTVVVDPSTDSPLMQEEIFGPILAVMTVASTAEAVQFVNARPKPLALYVFGEDDGAVEGLLDETTSGGACVNHVILHLTPPELPFGGVGDSGTGRYHGRSGFDTFSNLRSVLRKPTRPDPSLLYPPYGGLKERLIRRFA